ncbi:hypothetical protein PVL29_022857 [Vitis rotundifolia]|uniref:Uncharacterized protein n=1 Tax=Vitis rotundifolia TaxID=103349 RepID=A0AA38YWU4_VITRO|nr:hypothetical protein PVL29_022857 [Vitis rotundifolia]
MASDDGLDDNEELSAEFIPFALRSSFGSTSTDYTSAKFTLSKMLHKAHQFLQVFFQIQFAFILVSCLVADKSVFFVVLLPQKLFLDSEYGN